MKFEEMKKIWDVQNNEHLYVVDEKRLQQSIQETKKSTDRFVNKMEWLAIGANALTGSVILTLNFIQREDSIYSYVFAIIMLTASILIFLRRLHRIKSERKFDRSIIGDIEHAINNATYQVQLSYAMLLYIIPVGILVVLNAIDANKSFWKIILIAAFFVLVWFLGRWEHRGWHVARKKKLEAMREKLME